jgi:hypothetical protein
MKTLLEVFYLRIMDSAVCYQRKRVDLTKKNGDPDLLIRSLIEHKFQTEAGEVQEEFLVHSTSWRYASGKVTLTYVAYSDELEFGRGKVKRLSLKELRKINVSQGQPRSSEGLERQVVAHAMRHISFLIKTDYQGQFKDAFTPRTKKVFKSLWVSLAGRVAF